MAYDITAAALAAKQASQAASLLSTKEKNDALTAISRVLVEQADRVLEANAMDLAQAKENGMPTVMQDRLLLTKERIEGIAASVLDVVKLEDPVGQVVEGYRTVSGLNIQRIRVPMGVIGIIFESRPNVTVDAAALCLKAGSAVLLRGGKEAYRSNLAFVRLMQQALEECGLPKELIQLVEDTSRETATKMMKLNGLLDVLIPRGGAGLIRSCVENATVPVIETGTGNCHIYVDATADLEMAVNIVFNAKTSRPSVCNAAESLLVHRDVAQTFLPMCQKKLAEKNVEIRGCQETCKILGDLAVPATEEDYGKEFLDYIISCKVVGSVEEAIRHINRYSTGHSECIVTKDLNSADRFTAAVDSAAVYVNASTRFTDGGEFGLGAEIGISTQKLHARGPMGLKELTTVKYVIRGNGQVR
ncbi:MAG TPA: glutamate-5-semialdehyde dehydrogenase [Candidatus Egerieicola pullicola]|uniref:Gamma-glutamyl phosphate reductase n=1 Tax=Candidatus Egerieicola pullicola TaxID=2840775 RepID=A0A9D1DEK1_9FIRM|nr:glutamate-5-semialdehyde dehydrogenase [Candidatus Egerieicola pullicola]